MTITAVEQLFNPVLSNICRAEKIAKASPKITRAAINSTVVDATSY